MGDAVDFGLLAGPLENEYVGEWKASGRPVIGFFCAHAPEELLWAAGALPVRMRGTGSEDTSHADQYLGSFNCSFVRHTLSRVVKGDLAFLDGLLVTNSCDHIRRLFEVFTAKELAPFCHYLDVPHLNSEEAFVRLTGQLRRLQGELERHLDVKITQEALADAIQLYNRTRTLLARASALRSEDPPRAQGSEALTLAVAAASVPRDRFNELLEVHLEQLEAREPGPAISGPRLLVIGGTLDEPGYLEVIESLGASVVADQLCWGSKSFTNLADEEIDPIDSIARRMLDHMPCPRMVDQYPRRLADLLEAVKQHEIDGVICERLKFCDLWGGEIEMLRRSLKQDAQAGSRDAAARTRARLPGLERAGAAAHSRAGVPGDARLSGQSCSTRTVPSWKSTARILPWSSRSSPNRVARRSVRPSISSSATSSSSSSLLSSRSR
jgi:benzoyl-CoA reductase/2-hydroxyglutaryl-CoA dehydratase subunit BcrC/BadD/HgdB